MTKLVKCDHCGKMFLFTEFKDKIVSIGEKDFCNECILEAFKLLSKAKEAKELIGTRG
jgi:hypothetical protein